MIESLIISLLLTIMIELTISFIFGIREECDIYVVVLVNICTNPIIVYIANCLKLLNNDLVYNIVIVILEIIVVIVEFELYKRYLSVYKKSPFILSLVDNVLSFGIGLIINSVF